MSTNCESSEGPSENNCGSDEDSSLSLFDNEESSSNPQSFTDGPSEDAQLVGGELFLNVVVYLPVIQQTHLQYHFPLSDGLFEDAGGGVSTPRTEDANQEEETSTDIDVDVLEVLQNLDSDLAHAATDKAEEHTTTEQGNNDINNSDTNIEERMEALESNNEKEAGSKRKSPPSALTKQEQNEVREKSEPHSKAAIIREEKRFATVLLNQPRSSVGWPEGNREIRDDERTNMKNSIHQMISNTMQSKNGTLPNKTRVRYEYSLHKTGWKTSSELIELLIKCPMTVKDGKRPEEYTPQHCKVCLKAKAHEPYGHKDCPYCHVCFYRNPWKNKCLKHDECECCKVCKEACEVAISGHECPYCHLCFERGEGHVIRENCTCDQKPAAKGD